MGLFSVLSSDAHGQPLALDALLHDKGSLTDEQHKAICCALKCLGVC
jgi:hypothetical protein